jgi:hypothetical protein
MYNQTYAGFRNAPDFIPGVHLSVDVVNRGWWSVALLRSFLLGKLEPPELGFPAPQSSRTTVPAGDVGPRVNILSRNLQRGIVLF